MPKQKRKPCPIHETDTPQENTDITTALVSANIPFDSEDNMEHEARKRLRTATDGSLSTSYARNRTFVNEDMN